MANDINQCMFTGNLGRDPEKFGGTDGKKARATFSIAVNESYSTADGEKRETVTWVNFIAFDSIAEFCYQYLKKGQFVVVVGKLQVRKYTGRDGAEKTSHEYIVVKLRAPSGGRPKQDEESNPADDEGAYGSYGPDGGPRGYEAPRQQPYTAKPDPRSQSELYDKSGQAIIDDNDIPF